MKIRLTVILCLTILSTGLAKDSNSLAKQSTLKKHTKALTRLQKQCTTSQLLVDLIKPQEKWQQVLQALVGLDASSKRGAGSGADSRLVWLIAFQDDDYYDEYYRPANPQAFVTAKQQMPKQVQREG